MNDRRGIAWIDLTVPDAPGARDFYAAVMGWVPAGLDMGGYEDFNMRDPATGDVVAGVCHLRGENRDLPPVWMVYFRVDDLDGALAEVRARGGTVLSGIRRAGNLRYAMIRDPSGVACALMGGEE